MSSIAHSHILVRSLALSVYLSLFIFVSVSLYLCFVSLSLFSLTFVLLSLTCCPHCDAWYVDVLLNMCGWWRKLLGNLKELVIRAIDVSCVE